MADGNEQSTSGASPYRQPGEQAPCPVAEVEAAIEAVVEESQTARLSKRAWTRHRIPVVVSTALGSTALAFTFGDLLWCLGFGGFWLVYGFIQFGSRIPSSGSGGGGVGYVPPGDGHL